MEYPEPSSSGEDKDAIIVKADEVDEAGADISTISPTDASESEFNARIETRRAQDAQSSGSPKILANAVPSPPRLATRPILRREGSTPAPPQQPPPPAPTQAQESSGNTSSLSLQQLRTLITDLPKFERTAYAYEYSETRSFPEELEEWFSYTEEERYMLLRAKETFDEKWEQAQAERIDSTEKCRVWTDIEPADREKFTSSAVNGLESPELAERVRSLECISYIVLGAWGLTAGVQDQDEDIGLTKDEAKWVASSRAKPKTQLTWIANGVQLLCQHGAAQKLIDVLSILSDNEQNADIIGVDTSPEDEKLASSSRFLKQLEVNQTLTTLYLIVETRRSQYGHGPFTFDESLDSSLVQLLIRMISKLRWDENSYIPLPKARKILLLFWKSALLVLGSFESVAESKAALRQEDEGQENQHDESIITASPLDYHLFRQEITSKYPAYSPPAPLVPIEDQNNSILPPLSTHPSRQENQEILQPTASDVGSTNNSIFNQPVHIATPAPSPPPSPAGPGGKGGKKQNYQTNQNFPFLYPPLDDASNGTSSRTNTALQGQVDGGSWEGRDVPASILEAGQLFASRMRMSRSIRQLWDVREKYIKYERGWHGLSGETNHSSRKISKIDADDEKENEQDSDDRSDGRADKEVEQAKTGPDRDLDDRALQRRLAAIDDFYQNVLPNLQSVVMVLWRVLLGNVSALVAQNGQNGLPNGLAEDGDAGGRKRTNPNSSAHLNGLANGQVADNEDDTDPIVEELNGIRSREITSKAVSGLLLLMLKWFKLSHILKYEYLTQLLLDANYLPLILKYLAHQDVDRAVDQRNDREDLDFFSFCHQYSKHPPASPPQPALSPSSSSEDEAAPPPILKHRRSPTSQSPPPTPPQPAPRPEVDELGYPTSGALPQTPITNYAPRFFLTNINFLRLLQKITKRKAHRALLLVQYKSSTILRKALKIPQPDLRLYTLKLFKSQVPYCGRKWRQTNMRVITAIYLHCRPELRDEWLCGGDVDGVVEEAVPLEQACRSLVHWWHLREFKDVMEAKEKGKGVDDEEKEDEYDFFARELEKMGWGSSGVGGGEDDDGQGVAEAGAAKEFEGGPLAMEGWA
ncbi:Factor arrest protein 11 [Lecanora helva]